MATEAELCKHFAPQGNELAPEVLSELQSIVRLHSISPQELFYKWESYSMKMGIEPLKLELKTARDMKRDIQDALEKETRGKALNRSDKRVVGATPRAPKIGNDMFDMIEGVVQNSPRQPMSAVNGNSVKRKGDFDTPASKTPKTRVDSSPNQAKTPASGKGALAASSNVSFAERTNSGQILESLNGHIELPTPTDEPTLEPRVALKANTELKKFAYKTMAMKLSESSEILDDRIDEFVAVLQAQQGLEDSAFGNPAIQSPSEIVAVGRIASDTSGERLTSTSIVLETSRRMGAGLRVPLKLDAVPRYELFPGKVVAVRGSNASGEAFTVTEILTLPQLPAVASSIGDLDAIRAKLSAGSDPDSSRPLNIIATSGPYTADTNLAFEPLHALCDRAIETRADALVMLGPFLDVEHPLVAAGDIPPLPEALKINPDTATLTDVFRGLVAPPLQRLVQAQPGIVVIMVPSVRDAVSRHAAWPQDKLPRKELGLPKQCSMATNPVMLSLNEMVLGVSSHDALFELRREECVGGAAPPTAGSDVLARLSRHLIEQRHFAPLFPPSAREHLPRPAAVEGADVTAAGAMLDVGFSALAEWQKIKPDVLITPSALNPLAKVVESVVVVNPGPLSKRRGPGTFAQFYVGPRAISAEERTRGEMLDHRLFDRMRVDIVRI